MKLRDTNEPRGNERTVQTATTDGRTDGRTYERMDGGIDGRGMDSPTFRTNWSHEILGEPKKDRAARLRKEDEEVQATRWTARGLGLGLKWLKEERCLREYLDGCTRIGPPISILTASLSTLWVCLTILQDTYSNTNGTLGLNDASNKPWLLICSDLCMLMQDTIEYAASSSELVLKMCRYLRVYDIQFI